MSMVAQLYAMELSNRVPGRGKRLPFAIEIIGFADGETCGLPRACSAAVREPARSTRVSYIQARPGAANVIPGEVWLMIDMRAPTHENRHRALRVRRSISPIST